MSSYKIALINVFWSRDAIDTRFFDTTDAQSAYFDSLTGDKLSPLLNYNIGDNITTTVYYKDTSGRDIEDLLRCNYCVIYKLDDTAAVTDRRYFFVDRVWQDAGSQVGVKIDLDDIQTNYFKVKDTIKPCYINKAHLNRFIEDTTDTTKVKFNGEDNSPLFEDDDYPITSKRLISRQKVKWNFVQDRPESENQSEITNNAEVNDYLNTAVKFWVYVFIDGTQDYVGWNASLEGSIEKLTYGKNYTQTMYDESIVQSYGNLCLPVYEDGYEDSMILLHAFSPEAAQYEEYTDRPFRENALNIFRYLNQDTSYIYNIKISIRPPFTGSTIVYRLNDQGIFEQRKVMYVEDNKLYLSIGTGLTDYTATEYTPQPLNLGDIRGGRLIATEQNCGYIASVGCDNLLGNWWKVSVTYTVYSSAIFMGTNFFSKDANILISQPITLDYDFEFNKTDITGDNQLKFNPKLLSAKNMEVQVKDFTGNYFSYDLQKINSNTFTLQYVEAVTPEISKFYVALTPTGLYETGTDKNYTGLVNSLDMTVAITNDQMAQYLANNKNFWMQTALGAIGGGAENGLWASFFNVGLTAPSLIMGGLHTGMEFANAALTLDNLKNAPDSLVKSQGNALFANFVDDLGIYVEVHEALDITRQSLNDYTKEFGYNYRLIGNIGDFDNIRSRYNYLSANVEQITANLSNDEKRRLIDRLNSVRFWNSDTIDYNAENTENWILEGLTSE